MQGGSIPRPASCAHEPWPHYKSDDTVSTWQLVAPAGKKIRLEVLMLETEPQKDFLYLFNGTGTADPILAKLSGEGPIPVITSWNNQVLLWFVTDERNHFDGWTIRWEVVD